MYQNIVIVGNLGRDPELRYTPDGTPVCNFSVATNRRWTSSDGSPGEETTWFRITAWRRMAEVCSQYLQKGRQVLVEGHLRPDPETGGPRIWTGNDGQSRASFELTASSVKFLGGRGDASGGGDGASETAPAVEEEEIPF